MAGHLALVAARHHTQFRRPPRQTERRLVGVPAFPGQAPRSLGLHVRGRRGAVRARRARADQPDLAVGSVRDSPGTNGAQPDWYLGWLIGALRLVPGFDVTVGDYTLVPNPFWGGVLFPTWSCSRVRRGRGSSGG